jgi:hypothetical protein
MPHGPSRVKGQGPACGVELLWFPRRSVGEEARPARQKEELRLGTAPQVSVHVMQQGCAGPVGSIRAAADVKCVMAIVEEQTVPRGSAPISTPPLTSERFRSR